MLHDSFEFRIFKLSNFDRLFSSFEHGKGSVLLLEKQISGVPAGLPSLAAQLGVQRVILVRRIVQKVLSSIRVNFHSCRDLVHQTFRARVEMHT